MDFSSIDPHSSEQLYLQIRHLILRAIQTQELLPGQRIPSIAAIAAGAGVSRMTVRHALDALIADGWIDAVPGKGSFVTEKSRVVLDMHYLVGWSEELKMQGVEPATRLVDATIVSAALPAARALNVPVDTPLIRTVRVQYAEQTPLGVDTTCMIADRFPGFEALIAAEPASISRILYHHYGVYLLRGAQFVEAIGTDRATSGLLGVPLGTPVLLVQRTTYTMGDIPVQFVQAIHRSELVRFKVELSSTLPVLE